MKKFIKYIIYQLAIYIIVVLCSVITTNTVKLGPLISLMFWGQLLVNILVISVLTIIFYLVFDVKYKYIALSFPILFLISYIFHPPGLYGIVSTQMFTRVFSNVEFASGVSFEIIFVETFTILICFPIKKVIRQNKIDKTEEVDGKNILKENDKNLIATIKEELDKQNQQKTSHFEKVDSISEKNNNKQN